MELIGAHDVFGTLGSIRSALAEIHRDAWSEWDQRIRPTMPLASITAKAIVLHELVLHRVRTRLGGSRGVRIDETSIPGRFLVYLRRNGLHLLLQFKKFNDEGLTSNYPTDTSRRFDTQQEIEGLPSCPRLTVGYQMDAHGMMMTGVYLAYLVGAHQEWLVDLESGEGAIGLQFPEADRHDEDRGGAAASARA